MTRCEDIQVLLALRPEDWSVTEQRRVRAHLAVCAECASRAEAYAEQDRAIRSAPRVALTPSQRGQLLSTIERKRRRHEMRSRLFTVAGTAVAITALIALVVGAKLLGPSGVELIPGGLSHIRRGGASTARLRGVDFTVVDHEMTGCVTLGSGEERCPPEGARYVWVEMRVENSEHYPTADLGPQISVVHKGEGLQEMDFLPKGKSPRSACTPEGYYRDDACEFWIGASVPDGVASGDLTVRASWGEEVAVWPLGDEGEAQVFPAEQFTWPASRREISGWTFHDPRNPDHAGIDIVAEAGDPVFSIADGRVTRARWDDERGNVVVIDHTDGWSSMYAQLEEMTVDVGQTVIQGEIVGRAGSTGESSGPHLHFELHYHGRAVNPLDHLPSQADLRDLLLREEELPGTGLDGDDWKPEAIYLHGDDWVTNLAQADGCLEALKVEGFREIEEDEAGVYVWHSVYRFEEARQAREQYEELLAGDMLDSGEILYEGAGKERMQATALVFTGSEGEAIYWLFGVEDTVLHLLMVDSFWYEHTREIFETTVSRFVPIDLAWDLQDVEVELARRFVDDPDGECGWEVLGEDGMKSFVWAICQSPNGTAVSAPAVVLWKTGRETVMKIQMPWDGSFYEEDVRKLFPPEIQERIFEQDVDMEAIWEQIERDLTTVTGTVVDNAASAEVLTLEDEDGEEWHVPWRASRGVRWPDGSATEFRDIERGMGVEVVGFRREATTPNVLSAVRVTILSESMEATRPAPTSILDQEGAIAHSLNLLREQGVDRGHDNANFAEVRFPDGDRGAFVAIGFSGIAQGYQLLYRVADGEVVLADFISGPVDWGIWSLQDFETVELAFPVLFPGEDDGDREVIQVTGAGHAGTGAWLDGYFEIIEITEEGIRVLFSGAHASINANAGGFERHYEYAYEDLDDDGVKEIIQTGEECQLEPGESGLEKTDCQPVERVFQFDGLTYVRRAEEGTPPPDLSEMDVEAWTSTSPGGVWVARGLAAFSENNERGPDRYYTRLTVAQLDRSQEWTVAERWYELALGYTTPQPLRWSADGSHFYFTDRPVPDGCAVFVNGSDLQRVDLSDGSVTEIVPPVGLWLSLSPDERELAYVGYGDRGLVVRDLSTGRERQTQIEDAQETEDAHVGHVVWSPDGEMLVLTVAIDACGPPEETAHAIVRVDAETLVQTTLIVEDERLFTSEAWSERGRVSLKDRDGETWWLDPETGDLELAD